MMVSFILLSACAELKEVGQFIGNVAKMLRQILITGHCDTVP